MKKSTTLMAAIALSAMRLYGADVFTLQLSSGNILPYVEEVLPECTVKQDSLGVSVDYSIPSVIVQKDYLYEGSYWPLTRARLHVFGDPSMMIRTDVPLPFSDDEIKISNLTVTVHCEDSVFLAVKK